MYQPNYFPIINFLLEPIGGMFVLPLASYFYPFTIFDISCPRVKQA